MERTRHKKWIVRPVTRRECRRVWNTCPFNKILEEKYGNKLNADNDSQIKHIPNINNNQL